MLVSHNGDLFKVTKKAYRQIMLRLATKGDVDTAQFGKALGPVEVNLNEVTQDQALEQLDKYI
jgi:hypothetical protein